MRRRVCCAKYLDDVYETSVSFSLDLYVTKDVIYILSTAVNITENTNASSF